MLLFPIKLTFTCSKSTTEILKLWNMFKANKKTPERRQWRYFSTYFIPFSSVSIVSFEQVNVSPGAFGSLGHSLSVSKFKLVFKSQRKFIVFVLLRSTKYLQEHLSFDHNYHFFINFFQPSTLFSSFKIFIKMQYI